MSESTFPNSCPQCGASLPSEATAGLCPRCILAQAMQPPAAVAEDLTGLDVTVRVAAPVSSGAAKQEVDLPLPKELTTLLPHGSYSVESFLGQGGMGAVYKGTQIRLKRSVAIKIMRRAMGKDYDFEQRFEREAQAMAKLNHPNIVNVIDYGEAGPDYLYIVMELVDGADLMDVIRGGQMTQEMALSLLPQICDALQFAHDHGIVHRDIKPSNIMLTRGGRVKMADFGLAKHFDAENSFRTQTGTGMGTPDYAAPEQFDPTSAIDHRADIYALGVMIYQMITGQLPRGVWKPPSQRAEVAPQWDAIVSRAMQSDPSDRYQHASEVKTDVSSIPLVVTGRTAGPSAAASAASGPVSTSRPLAAIEASSALSKSRAPLRIALVTGVLVLAAGSFYAFKKTSQPSSPTASTSTVPSSSPIVEPWVRMWNSPERLSNAVTLVDGWVVSKAGGTSLGGTLLYPMHWHDSAIRSEWKWAGGPSSGYIGGHMSIRAAGKHRYTLSRNKKAVRLERTGDDNLTVLLQEHPMREPKEGETFTLELRAIGTTLVARLDGKEIIHVEDDKLNTGGPAVYVFEKGGMRNIEVLNLDKPALISPSLNPPVSKSSDPKFPPGQWVKLFTKVEDLPADLRKSDRGVTWEDGWIKSEQRKVLPLPIGTLSNFGVRARFMRKTTGGGTHGGGTCGINIRSSATQRYHLRLLDNSMEALRFVGAEDIAGLLVFSAPMSPEWQPGTETTVEFAVIGRRLIGRAGGSVFKLGDNADIAAGGAQISGTDDIRDIEVINLDSLPEAEALRLLGVDEKGNDLRGKSSAAATIEPWLDILHDLTGLALSGGVERAPGGLRFIDAGSAMHSGSQRDGAVRMRAIFGGSRPMLRVRSTPNVGDYQLAVKDEAAIRLTAYDSVGRRATTLQEFSLREPVQPGQDYELELRVVGQTLTAKFNGEVIGSVLDETFSKGEFGVRVTDRGAAPALVETLEVLNLDLPSIAVPSSSLPALPRGSAASSHLSATKDAPFINTLGMKFVPVPIIGGPTDKQRVLFSIWETRVQDYEAFVKEAGLRSGKPKFEQGPAHPAVMMSWEAAQAFCTWLTERERKAGKLAANERYRLPSDHEWSCAVGIGDQEDPSSTPQDKSSKKVENEFPWGTAWPPPRDGGNFRGEEAADQEDNSGQKFLPGFRDDFPATAPVGSFKANAFGVFDLAGNVREWCEDVWKSEDDSRVWRGSSFNLATSFELRSSYRHGLVRQGTGEHTGFRCVLATEAAPSASKAAAPLPHPPL